jgi:transposase
MRIRHWPVQQIYLYRDAVDFRKNIDGLAAIVELELGHDPFAESLFVFSNRQRDKVKLLYWERTGFVLWYKRLEKNRFHWPSVAEGSIRSLSVEQLSWLLEGIDLDRLRPHQGLHFRAVMSA